MIDEFDVIAAQQAAAKCSYLFNLFASCHLSEFEMRLRDQSVSFVLRPYLFM